MAKKLIPHPGQKIHPDLKTPIESHRISDDGIFAEVSDGKITFTDMNDGHNVTISEWDLGNFIDTWLISRMNERPYMSSKAEVR